MVFVVIKEETSAFYFIPFDRGNTVELTQKMFSAYKPSEKILIKKVLITFTRAFKVPL